MPAVKQKMTSTLSNLSGFFKRGSADGNASNGVKKAQEGALFDKCDPEIDGEDCLHDCESCAVKYPAKFSIDETEKLYGHVKGWSTHLLVATGKIDWVRDVADEKGSVMEAVDKHGAPKNGRLMLSASNIPVPHHEPNPYAEPTRCLLLPSFTWIDGVSPSNVPQLIDYVSSAPTNVSRLESTMKPIAIPSNGATRSNDAAMSPWPSGTASDVRAAADDPSKQSDEASVPITISSPFNLPFQMTSCPHSALILMCSQKTRDARCGQSAPLLKKEFERHLRPLGLYRDINDERPGGVGVYFISHVGGHKFSANVMIYRKAGFGKRGVTEGGSGIMLEGTDKSGVSRKDNRDESDGTASQCIWLARVRPEDCENIVRYTVMQGKVVKPERQLRGGFDREKGLISW